MKTVLAIFGTRPEAIKMAPVIQHLKARSDDLRCDVCVTAQHRRMLDQVLDLFEVKPDFDLDLMQPNQDLFDITNKVLHGLKPVLESTRPDLVLVHGDTTTTMAAALAAFYEDIPVGHVEAGLRTGDKRAPFPEEVNRRIAGVIADIHFAPTQNARKNLLYEGIRDDLIFVTGNTVIDALLATVTKIQEAALGESIAAELIARTPSLAPTLADGTGRRLVLVTGHRRENFGSGFENIGLALRRIAERYPDLDILYPVHLNPNVQEPIRRHLGGTRTFILLNRLITFHLCI